MRYLLTLFVSIVVSGCGTTQGGNSTKTLNVSNLQKTNHGTLRLVPTAIKVEDQIKIGKGIPYNPAPNSVKEVDIFPKVYLPPKQAQLKAETSFTKEGQKTEPLIIVSPKEIESIQEKGPSMRVNWGGLIMYYLLIAWVAAIIYILYKHFSKSTEPNPFKEEKVVEKKPAAKKANKTKKSGKT